MSACSITLVTVDDFVIHTLVLLILDLETKDNKQSIATLITLTPTTGCRRSLILFSHPGYDPNTHVHLYITTLVPTIYLP